MFHVKVTVDIYIGDRETGQKLCPGSFSREMTLQYPPYPGLELAFHVEPDSLGNSLGVLRFADDERGPRLIMIDTVFYFCEPGFATVSGHELFFAADDARLAMEQYQSRLGFSEVYGYS